MQRQYKVKRVGGNERPRQSPRQRQRSIQIQKEDKKKNNKRQGKANPDKDKINWKSRHIQMCISKGKLFIKAIAKTNRDKYSTD